MPSCGFILHMVSEKKIFKHFLRKLSLFAAPTTNQIHRFGQSHMKRRGLLNKHFCKKIPNISIETEKIAIFHFSHYKSMGPISCQSNQSSYPTGIKNFLFPLPIDAICGIWKESASRLQRRCRLKMLTDDGRTTDAGYLSIL